MSVIEEGIIEAKKPAAGTDEGWSSTQMCIVPCELAQASSGGLIIAELKAKQWM